VSARKDGGPAFPADPNWFDPSTVAEARRIAGGMSLRDYFAAKALPGLMGRDWSHMKGQDQAIIEAWARGAYAVADAMLAAREEA
jgi:hypothetical protein